MNPTAEDYIADLMANYKFRTELDKEDAEAVLKNQLTKAYELGELHGNISASEKYTKDIDAIFLQLNQLSK